MLNHLKLWTCLLVSMLLGLVCGSVLAEDSQQVLPPPAIKYALASPRACLIGPAGLPTNDYYIPPLGAAENFPRADGEIKVPAGIKVIFCLSRELEGVWYRRSYGRLRWSLVLQMYKPCPEGDDVDCAPWVTIGHDAAGDVRRGPSIGRAKVGVPVLFRRPGVYLLRGIIRTVAEPMYPWPTDESEPEHLPAAVDEDIVHIRVKVANLPIIQIVPDEEPPADPDAVHIRPIPKEINTDDE